MAYVAIDARAAPLKNERQIQCFFIPLRSDIFPLQFSVEGRNRQYFYFFYEKSKIISKISDPKKRKNKIASKRGK